jgi:hypothetical protein
MPPAFSSIFRSLLTGMLVAALMIAARLMGSDPKPGPDAARPLFVEDFESGRIDPDIWSIDATGGNVVAVQTDRAAHGRFALRVSCPAPANKTWAFLSTSHLPAALKQHQFGRVYMYVTPKPPARHTIFIMSGTPGFPFNTFEEVATANARWQLTWVRLRAAGNEEDYHSAGSIPLGRWFCLEWEFNDNPNHAAIWVDGKPVFDSGFVSKTSGATANLVGGFTDLALGFRLWGAAPEAFDVYYDDIAVDTKPIGPIEIKPPMQ